MFMSMTAQTPIQKNSVMDTLSERGKDYGTFWKQAAIAQHFKKIAHTSAQWETMNTSQKEALDMILHKIARLLNGNPNKADTWHDIAGYATLVEKELNGEFF